MPANIRIRCKYIDCQFLDGLFCGATIEVELDPNRGCLTFIAAKVETDEDQVDEDELLDEEDDWLVSEDELEEDEEENPYGDEE